MDFIHSFSANPRSAVIDIGGGSSLLVDRLLEAGYPDLTVLDISEEALAIAKKRLASAGDAVAWISEGILQHRFGIRYPLMPAQMGEAKRR